jgi:hypothetical protein
MRQLVIWTLVGVVCIGCSTIPQAPNVRVYKGETVPFDLYQQQDAYCQTYAKKELGIDPEHHEEQAALTQAAIIGAVGAGLGAAIGAATGSPAMGAAIGGAAGLVTGGASGSARAQRQGMTLQQRFDQAYLVCMAAYSHTTIVPR